MTSVGSTALSARTGSDAWLQRDAARLRYRCEGSGANAIVFVHGWTLDLDMWEPQVAAFQSDYRVIRWDRRGSGFSIGRPSLDLDVGDAMALCGHLGVQRAVFVGMSQGARVVCGLAALAPGLVAGVVLDGAPDLRPDGSLTLQDMPLGRYRQLIATQGLDAFRAEWSQHPLARLRSGDTDAQRLVSTMLSRYSGADLAGDAPQPDHAPQSGDAPRLGDESQPGDASRPGNATRSDALLAALTMPALILNGEFDVQSRLDAGAALARALPHSHRVIVPHAGHLANLDNPMDYNRALRDFLTHHAVLSH
ncbi:MAG TPA: alpha/beta hydrolase [Steroidobacteraceae bacterium]|nr:alpha/beta hydrolase [Steroidobacteraceae bacterium]